MTMPNVPNPRLHRWSFIKNLLWATFLVIIVGLAVDTIFGFNQRVARGVALGGLLVFVAQSSFAYLTFKAKLSNTYHVDTRPPSQMLASMTIALVIKWLIVFVGFVLIFHLPYQMSTLSVLLGFMLMQVISMLSLLKFS